MRENKEILAELDGAKMDMERLNGLLEKVQADKRMMGEKVQLVTNRGEANCKGKKIHLGES